MTSTQPTTNTIITAASVPLLPAWTLTRPADELPAKMPRETDAPLMDADTAPIMETPVAKEYAVGDVVRFHYFLSNCDSDLYTGRIAGFKESARWGKTALIVDIQGTNRNHVPPRYVSMGRIKAVIAAPVTTATQDEPFTREDVERLEKEWHAAQDAPRDFDEAISDKFFAPSRAARIAYLVAYATYHNAPWMMPSADDIEMLKASKNALKSSDTGVSSPSTPSQVTSHEMADTPAPLTQADDFIPVSTDTYVHPMRLIQEGSAAAKLPDVATLKAKRDQQYAEAYQRIHGVPFVRKGAS